MKRFLIFALAISCGACGRAAVTDSQANLQLLRSEHTEDKLVRRGLAFAELGDLTRAEQYLTAALDQGAPPRRVIPPLLHVCLAAGRHRAALAYAREFGAPLAGDLQFRYLLATLESAVGDPDKAVQELRRILLASPRYVDAHYQLALLLQRRGGDDEQVALHLREYLKLSPDGPFAEDARTRLDETCGVTCPRAAAEPTAVPKRKAL